MAVRDTVRSSWSMSIKGWSCVDKPGYSRTSIMPIRLVPSKVSWVKRCSYFGSFQYIIISGRCGNVHLCHWALWRWVAEFSLAVQWRQRITRGKPCVPVSLHIMSSLWINQLDNLVREACQRLHVHVHVHVHCTLWSEFCTVQVLEGPKGPLTEQWGGCIWEY